MSNAEAPGGRTAPLDFIRSIVAADLASGKHRAIVTRFPPEPNGYLHIGHAKSICLNFGIAAEFGGVCNLRFDDTNPTKEDLEYVEAIKADVRWLGFEWAGAAKHASDYFEQLYRYAEDLIRKGLAYVDSLSAEEIRTHRGTLTEPGRDSPYRDRPVAENLELFRRMRAGGFPDGVHVLRAKIDMGSPNINMRDPAIYRIRHAGHQMTGDRWRIYPMYDYAHCISDALEGITHSLCTLEFEDHRPLYDWFLDQLDVPCHPQQIEFSRLNLEYTVMSKRMLNTLVRDGHVRGWDDPRMPTISGMRRRGYPPESIRDFCRRIGVTKSANLVELALLENCVREDLERRAPRAMGVLRPLRLVIDNYPEDRVETFDCPRHPGDPAMGSRAVPFSRVVYIERDDFLEEPPPKYFRLSPGREVRLRYAYIVRCTEIVKDAATGEVSEVHCTYDPATRGGDTPDGRKIKGTIHWVSAAHGLPARVRLYDRLFSHPDPAGQKEVDFHGFLNPQSLEDCATAVVEPALGEAAPEARFQLERLGYFCVDGQDSKPGCLVLNRTVTLRDSWSKLASRAGGPGTRPPRP